MDLTWQQAHRFAVLRMVDVFLNQKGKQYVFDMREIPYQVAVEFREWMESRGKDVFIRNNHIRNYVRYTTKHRLYTRPKFKAVKKATGMTDEHFAKACGYKNANVFKNSPFRWYKVTCMLNMYDALEERKYFNDLIAA